MFATWHKSYLSIFYYKIINIYMMADWIAEQIAELSRGAEIIVCTPGRIINMLAANSGRVANFRSVSYIVFDEANQMFDLGYELHVMSHG